MQIRDHYEVQIHPTAEPVSHVALDACEQSLAVKFPSAYGEFLLRHNGGKPTPSCFLLNHVMRPEIELFYSVAPAAPHLDISSVCRELRTRIALPQHLLPIAQCASETVLLLSCADHEAGRLYYCPWPDETFHLADHYSTAYPVYFPFDQLLHKLGPAGDREDKDSLFLHLYYAAANPQSGARLARKLVDAGYDINFVLPGFQHPIFSALSGDAFSIVQELAELGTRANHVDRKGVSLIERLNESLEWWTNQLEEPEKRGTVHGMAKRRIAAIQATLAVLSQAAQSSRSGLA